MSIKMQDVSYNYGHEDVIKKINLDFIPGQLVSLVGPNGAGKTTLLKLISGVLDPTSGQIHINDQLSENLSNKENKFELVAYQDSIQKNLTEIIIGEIIIFLNSQ